MFFKAYVDTPESACSAHRLGVPGIYRTEPALLGPDRIGLMRSVVLAEDPNSRDRAVEALLPLHRADLKSVFRALSRYPITARLLDAPLDRFLPTSQQIAADYAEAQSNENYDDLFTLASLRHRVSQIRADSSSSHRGCRLSLTHPHIFQLQVTAILEAALELQAEGVPLGLTLLVPLVSSEQEVSALAKLAHNIAADVFFRSGDMINYQFAALLESPGATLRAAEISDHVDVIAFGTNDLTRMTYGFSNDDIATYLGYYLERGVLTKNPFVAFDQRGVGHLLKCAIGQIRQHN